jgi:hypothetical protein
MGICGGLSGNGAVFLLVRRLSHVSNIPEMSHTQSDTDVTKFSNLQRRLTKNNAFRCVIYLSFFM